MSAAHQAAAPTGRNKPAQGKERSDAALGHASQNTPSPEGAKEGGENDPWQIPARWRWSTMGEVATVIGGGTPKSDQAEYFGGDIPWITPADLSGYTEKFISAGARSITQAGLENSGARVMPAGAVLFSSRAPIGYVAIAANPVSTNQGFKSFVLRDELTSDFVYYYLQHAKKLAVEMASGTTFLEISGKKAAQLPIPIAPFPEQRRIVAEIEKQFTRLEAGVAALRRVQANLKRYRAAVLKAACEGRLVPTEAELAKTGNRKAKFETGETLLARILTERRKNWQGRSQYKEPASPDIRNVARVTEGWAWASVDQLADDTMNRSTDTLLTRALLKLEEKSIARLWQQTVDAKCRNQYALAEHLAPDDPALPALHAAAWGRKPHKEAGCAKMFWQIFGRSQGEPEFTRDRASGGLNNLLNYGYAVLLSTILQKLFGVGLDPTWGISHAPRERSTPLAYDLMEPFRPCVDWRVVQWVRQQGGNGASSSPEKPLEVTPEFRKWVTGFPLERVEYLDLTLDVRGCIEGVVRGFRRAVLGGDTKFYRPWTPKNSKWAG